MLNLFKRSNKKRIFLAGWEVRFYGDKNCEDFIATQVTTKNAIKRMESGIELIFENDRLVKAYDHDEVERQERKLEEDEIGYPYKYYEPHKYLQSVENLNGYHQLGGEIPYDFKCPDNNCIVPFQYLGFINNEDDNFSWLPFKLHLTCPIYLNFDKIFLDYNNPNYPVIINREIVESADNSFGNYLNRDSEIVFNELKYNFIEVEEYYSNGTAGVPIWIQYPDIPNCPLTGKLMRFVCQFRGGVNAKRYNVVPENEYYRRYFEELNFWCDGQLFVFFEPESRIACYFIQNT